MTASIFQRSRLENQETPQNVSNIFKSQKLKSKEPIVPFEVASPELQEMMLEGPESYDKVLNAIKEAEYFRNETPVQAVGRNVLGLGARLAEGFGSGITGLLSLMTPELYESEEGMPYSAEERPKGFPGQEEFRKFTKSKTGGYLEPQSDLAKSSQEWAGDIGTALSSGQGWAQSILSTLGGQIAKEGVKGLTKSETKGDLAKLGFLGIASIARLGNAPKIAGLALDEAKAMLPQGLRFSAQPTINALQRLKNQPWYRTGKTASKSKAFEKIEQIENKIINNRWIDGQDAMQLRHDINEARKELGAFTLPVPGQVIDKKAAKKYLNEVDKALLESMENYGTKVNPEWWKTYNEANKAFAITQRSRQISDMVGKYAKPLQSETAKVMFHLGAASLVSKLPVLAVSAAPVMATAKSIQIMNRVFRSPVLRQHYADVLKYAAQENSLMLGKTLKKFDAAAKKEEERVNRYKKNKKSTEEQQFQDTQE